MLCLRLREMYILVYPRPVAYNPPPDSQLYLPAHSGAFSFCSPTSNATKNRLTRLYPATVAVISTISLSLNPAAFNAPNVPSSTCTSRVIASAYRNTAHSASDSSPCDVGCSCLMTLSFDSVNPGESSRMGACAFHSNQALLIRAGRQMAISRMESGREFLVRIAPRREFQPEYHMQYISRVTGRGTLGRLLREHRGWDGIGDGDGDGEVGLTVCDFRGV